VQYARPCAETNTVIALQRCATAEGDMACNALPYIIAALREAHQYRRLRRWAAAEEERTGRRITHHAVFEAALAEFLDKHGG
jgi:hypothetical protein